MSMHEVAKHLSAMGRNGDSMLVHMSPAEVRTMNGIASLSGGGLTVNPETGLPEAFSFGNFFKSLLPTIVGAVAAPLTGGGSLIPVLAGAATGAALNGQNPLMGALSGGLGGFGGAGIGNALSAASAAPTIAKEAGTAANAATAAENAISATPNIAPAFNEAGTQIGKLTSFGVPSEGITAAQQTAGQEAAARSLAASAGQAPAPTGLAALGTKEGLNAAVQSLGGTGPNASLIAAGKAAFPLGMAALSGVEPAKPPGEEKYDPYASLNLGGDSDLNLGGDSGLRFFAEGGSVYETADPGSNTAEDAIEAREYGIGGLSRYAGGGKVGLFSDAPGLNLNAPDAPSRNPYGLVNNFLNNPGSIRNAFGAEGQGLASPLFTKAPIVAPMYMAAGIMGGGFNQKNPYIQNLSKNDNAWNIGRSAFSKFLNLQPTSLPPVASPGLFADSANPSFAKGGFLDGPGDGMSDSIPATIEGKQPARLADGEFVVPADVVSHLGNGSTKAGAQRLYDMMDKVRKARTGHTKQGKQINPRKYMPA